MAEKAGGKHAPKTTVAPTRAAKGAGAGKNLRKPPEPKARIPEPKKTPTTPTPPPLINDTRTPEERQKDFRNANLLKLTADHRKVQNELDVLAEQTSEVNGRKKQIRAGIETLGYSLEEFDRAMKDAGSTKIDLAQNERMRSELREFLAVYVPPQGDLFDKSIPAPARDELFWEGEGYKAGVHATKMEPSDHNVPPDMVQAFMNGVANGQARNAWAGRESDRLEVERQTHERQIAADREAADLVDKANAPGDDVVVEPSALDLRRAAKAEETRARESLERMGSDASAPEVSDEVPDPVEDEFEAGDEELSAQRGRPSTIDATDPEPASAGTGEGEQIV